MSNRSNVSNASLILPSVKGRLRNRGLEVGGEGGGAGEEGGGRAAGRRGGGGERRGRLSEGAKQIADRGRTTEPGCWQRL